MALGEIYRIRVHASNLYWHANAGTQPLGLVVENNIDDNYTRFLLIPEGEDICRIKVVADNRYLAAPARGQAHVYTTDALTKDENFTRFHLTRGVRLPPEENLYQFQVVADNRYLYADIFSNLNFCTVDSNDRVINGRGLDWNYTYFNISRSDITPEDVARALSPRIRLHSQDPHQPS
jgi:hypothetical protein